MLMNLGNVPEGYPLYECHRYTINIFLSRKLLANAITKFIANIKMWYELSFYFPSIKYTRTTTNTRRRDMYVLPFSHPICLLSSVYTFLEYLQPHRIVAHVLLKRSHCIHTRALRHTCSSQHMQFSKLLEVSIAANVCHKRHSMHIHTEIPTPRPTLSIFSLSTLYNFIDLLYVYL